MTTTTTRTATMRAVVQRGYGRPEEVLHLREVSRPAPAADEALVRVRATSVNTPDWVTVLGEPRLLRLAAGLRGPRTTIRGTDVAGVVVQVGADVDDLVVGDEVFGSAWTSGIATPGAFCEFAAVPARMLARKPAAVSFEHAAASVMSGLTSLIGMRDVARARPGLSVLVNGASGGLGTFMVQLGNAMGAEVTGVCSTRNVELVRALGAARVVDHTQTDVTTLDERFDVVIDNVLNHPVSTTARLVEPGGLLVPNSVGQGGPWAKGLPRIVWTTLRGRFLPIRVATITYDVDRSQLAELADLLVAGQLRAVVDSSHGLAQAPSAVARMASHRARGNVAVVVP